MNTIGFAKPKNRGVKNTTVVAWNPSTLFLLMNSITTLLLLVALGIFVWLAVRSRNIVDFYNNLDFGRDNWYSSG
ncbi:MAG: hypothetical protein M3Y53_11740 [Thermoproteota archaeon]|nr:hypothetical protein [Thermoproteota archaeon]